MALLDGKRLVSQGGRLLNSRARILRQDLDLGRMVGVEIGPLADPVVHKSEGTVIYVDHTDAASLRNTYKDNPLVAIDRIVEVDAIWGERTLAESLRPLLGADGKADYVIASHVAEHVPDLVGWLVEVSEILTPTGSLRLALPDRRFSFDALRAPTRLSDVLTAWMLRARKPQVRDVLDFRLHYAPSAQPHALYEGSELRADLVPAHSFETAVEAAGWARDLDVYLDVHCTVAHPREWATLLSGLARLGLVRMACADMVDTTPEMFEFYVVLTPCADAEKAANSWIEAAERMRDPLPGSVEERAAATKHAEMTAMHGNVGRLEAALAEARARIDGIERSRSWRVTAPLRRLLRR